MNLCEPQRILANLCVANLAVELNGYLIISQRIIQGCLGIG